MPISYNKKTRFLFVGDAATDSNRSGDDDGIGTGTGYVRMIRDYLRAMSTATAPVVINRGRAGQRLPDLLEQCPPGWLRWRTSGRSMAESASRSAPCPRCLRGE